MVSQGLLFFFFQTKCNKFLFEFKRTSFHILQVQNLLLKKRYTINTILEKNILEKIRLTRTFWTLYFTLGKTTKFFSRKDQHSEITFFATVLLPSDILPTLLCRAKFLNNTLKVVYCLQEHETLYYRGMSYSCLLA